MESDLEAAIVKLVAYCRANDWAGYDPYDALNSPIFRTLPFLDHRLPRLVFTQALKRSPVNFRGLLHIPKTQNPKGIALFLSALVTLERSNLAYQKNDIEHMIERLCDPEIAWDGLLVLGIQFSLADADDCGSLGGAQPGLYVVRRQRATGCFRSRPRFAMSEHGCECRRLHSQRALLD